MDSESDSDPRGLTVAELLDMVQNSSLDDASFADDVEAAQQNQPKLPPSKWDSD